MTYGWTILVILMAGAALVYFDVLNPGKFLPDNCNVQSFSCTDFKVTSTSAEIYLTNNVGDDIIFPVYSEYLNWINVMVAFFIILPDNRGDLIQNLTTK